MGGRRGRRTTTWVAAVTAALLLVPAVGAAAGPPEPIDAVEGTLVGRSAATDGLNGIYVSPVDGNVYAASVGGGEITAHDPNNGKVVDRFDRVDPGQIPAGVPGDGVNGPDDLYITQDGTIYWTEILTGFVGMRTPDGEVRYQFVQPGVNPITMSNDETRLFVGAIFIGDGAGLWELEPDFDDDPFDAQATEIEPSLIVNGFDFGPDGKLYAPEFFTGNVLRIDVDATPPTVDVVASGLPAPVSSVKFDSLGTPHVVALGEGQVFALDLVGGDHELVLDIEGTIDNMAFDADDRLYAAVGADNTLVVVDGDRTRVLGKPSLGLPGGLAVSPDGTVWVSELFALRGIGSNKTQYARSFYDRFPGPNEFAGSTTVAADGDDLIITSAFSNSVQVLDPATGEVSFDERMLAGPTNAIRHEGRIVVTQLFAANVVDAENPADVLLGGAPFGIPIIVPLGLASDGGTLYVGDWATGVIWAVGPGGAVPLATGLSFPEGLAVDGDRLLVVETGAQRVLGIDLATGARSDVIVGLDFTLDNPAGFFPFGNISSVAVGNGSIYVSADGTNTVHRFRTPPGVGR